MSINPYEPALKWIKDHYTTGSSVGLAKLILSLWNADAAFSFRECMTNFDDIRSAWAQKIIEHFLKHREDRYLYEAGQEVCKLYPRLWEEGIAGSKAKRDYREQRSS